MQASDIVGRWGVFADRDIFTQDCRNITLAFILPRTNNYGIYGLTDSDEDAQFMWHNMLWSFEEYEDAKAFLEKLVEIHSQYQNALESLGKMKYNLVYEMLCTGK